MKKLILLFILVLFVCLNINAQANYKATPNEFIAKENTFDVPGKTATEIYENSKLWISRNYPNPKRFTINDVPDKLLQVKYFFEIPSGNKKIKIKYHLTIEIKNEKVKVTIDNLNKSGSINYFNFFDKDGSIVKDSLYGIKITEIEKYVNEYIDKYIKFINTGETW